MPDKTVTVILQTRDEMSKGLKDISKSLDGLTKQLGKSKEESKKTSRAWKLLNKDIVSFKQVTKGLTVAAGVIAGVGAAIAVAAKRGEELRGLRGALNSLAATAGETGDTILTSMQEAAQGLVSNAQLMEKANTALLLGLPVTAKSMGDLTEGALILSRAMGIDATKGLESVIVGIGRQSKLWLDNLGIIVPVEAANEKMAASLGKAASELTDVERKTAFYNATVEQMRLKVEEIGELQLGLGGQIAQARISLTNFIDSMSIFVSVMGDRLLPVLTKAFGLTDDFGRALKFDAEIATSFTKDVLSFLIDGFVLYAGTITSLLNLYNVLQFALGQLAGGFIRLGETLLSAIIEPMQLALEGARLLARGLGLLKTASKIQGVSTSLQGVQDSLENARKTTVEWANRGLKDITSNTVALDKMSGAAAELRAGIQQIQAPDIVEAMNGAAVASGKIANNTEEIAISLGESVNASKEILKEFERAAKLDFKPFDRAETEKQVKIFSDALGAADFDIKILTDEDLTRLRDRMKSLATDFGDSMLGALTSGDALKIMSVLGDKFSDSLGGAFSEAFGGVVGGLGDAVGVVDEDLGSAIKDLDIAGFSVGGILQAITQISKELPSLLFASIREILVNVFEEFPLLLGNILPDLIVPIIKLIPKVMKGFAENLAPMIDAIILALPDLILALVDLMWQMNPVMIIFNIINGAMNQWMAQGWPGVKDRLIRAGFDAAIQFIRGMENLPETLTPALAQVWTDVSTEISGWWQRTIWSDLTEGLGEVMIALAEQFNELFIEPFVDAVGMLMTAGSEVATQITASISDGATEFGTQMATFATTAAMLLVKPFLDMIEQLRKVAADIGDALSLPEAEKGVKGFIEGATGLSFQKGTTFVPFTGPAMLHQGEAVIPRDQNPFAGGGAGGGIGDMNFNIEVNISGGAALDGAEAVEAFVRAFEENVRASGDRIRNVVNRSGI